MEIKKLDLKSEAKLFESTERDVIHLKEEYMSNPIVADNKPVKVSLSY